MCEQAKKQLSTSFETQIKVLSLSGNNNFELRLEKSEFEELVQGTLEKVKEPVRKALEDAELGKEEVNKVVLVGGSTRIPWVKDWLREEFGFEPYDQLNADEGVAKGATMMAGILSGQFGQAAPVLQDLTPLSLGVRLQHD